jgi:hypothetical protein
MVYYNITTSEGKDLKDESGYLIQIVVGDFVQIDWDAIYKAGGWKNDVVLMATEEGGEHMIVHDSMDPEDTMMRHCEVCDGEEWLQSDTNGSYLCDDCHADWVEMGR